MALDKEYFDNIHIDLVRKRYYEAQAVDSLLADIRLQAEALTKKEQDLRSQLRELDRRRAQIGDSLLSAHAAAKEIVDRARCQADQILAQARQERDTVLAQSGRRQEQAAACVGQVLDVLRQQQLDNVELINRQWQAFLCTLNEDGEEEQEEGLEATVKQMPTEELEAMLGSIARDLDELLGDKSSAGA